MVVRLHEVDIIVEWVIVTNFTVAPDQSIASAPRSGVGARRPRDQSVKGGEIADSCPAHEAHDGFVQV